MTEDYQNELIEKLKELEISELLDILLNEDNLKTKKVIKNFIGENFVKSPQLELDKSIQDIEKMNYPDFIKERLKITKICVRDIKDRLDIEHINSMAEIEILISETIKISKVLIED